MNAIRTKRAWIKGEVSDDALAVALAEALTTTWNAEQYEAWAATWYEPWAVGPYAIWYTPGNEKYDWQVSELIWMLEEAYEDVR